MRCLFLFAIIMSCSVESYSQSSCVPMRFRIPAGNVGYVRYARVHPSGQYVLIFGQSGRTEIVDLFDRNKKGEPKVIQTDLNKEAYPVEPSWEYISAPYHKEGMVYHRFEDLLTHGMSSTPAFSDPDHDEYYQSIGELEGSSANKRRFRVLLFSSKVTREYVVTRDGAKTKVEMSDRYNLCQHFASDTEAVKKARERYFQLQFQFGRLSQKYQTYESTAESARIYEKGVGLDKKIEAAREEFKDSVGEFDQPVLSKNGTELAGKSTINDETVVLKILDNGACEIKERLGHLTSKVDFSYPKDLSSPAEEITYITDIHRSGENSEGGVPTTERETVAVYNRDLKEEYDIGEAGFNYSYPNFTRDGRVIVISSSAHGKGTFIEVIDPNQVKSEEGHSSCILSENLPAGTPHDIRGRQKDREIESERENKKSI